MQNSFALRGLSCLFVALATSVHSQTPPPNLSVSLQPNQQVAVGWRDDGLGYVLEEAEILAEPTVWFPVEENPFLSGDQLMVTVEATGQSRFFRLRLPDLTSVAGSSPADGETGVAVLRETIIYFSAPLADDAVITTDKFFAGSGGRKLLSRVELSSDRTKATLFYLEPMPGSTRISVVFDGSGLKDKLGRFLDADGDGIEGGARLLTFDTLSLTPLPGTAVMGRVFASELVPGPDTGTNAVNKPLAGVTITVDGMEQSIRAVTDAQGNFTLNNTPAGRFFVHIDGRTVSDVANGIQYPDKAYYPFVGKAWDAVAGRTDNKAGGTGEIYLPLIAAGTLQTVSATQDTIITFPPAVLAANPALAGVNITVPANSLFSDNGSRGGKVGIAAVPPDRLPGPLPPGLEPPIVITVQTDGGLNFDRPAPICFPNLPDPVLKTPLPAGSKQALISFNHDKGIWEAVGSMTVSADGKFICTDEGVGILQPGWHGVAPPPDDPPPCEDLCCPDGGGGGGGPSGGNRTFGRIAKAGPKPAKCDKPCKNRNTKQQCLEQCGKTFRECMQFAARAGERCLRNLDNSTVPYCEAPGDCFRVVPCVDLRTKYTRTCLDLQDQCYAMRSILENGCHRDLRDCVSRCQDECPKPGLASRRPAKAGPAEDLIAAQILEKLAAIDALYLPYLFTDLELTQEVGARIEALRGEIDALAGGDVLDFWERFALQLEEEQAASDAEFGEDPGNAPPYPVLYAAEIERGTNSLTLRGETGPFGQYSLFVPRDGEIVFINFYDPRTKRIGTAFPKLRPTALHRMPRFNLSPVDETFDDMDGDGLADAVEFVYGTDPQKADSDGDGIPDGAEIDQGTNPLDGRPGITGIIATVKTPGPAVDVLAGNDLVVTAEGNSGISIFNAFGGLSPTLIAHLPVPGNAQRVTGTGNFIAVAAGDEGLAIIDVGTPAEPRIIHQLRPGGTAQAVAVGTGLVYVGLSSGSILVVDPASGLVTDRVRVPDPVLDLSVSGETLYALTFNQLFAIPLNPGSLGVAGFLFTQGASPNQRLFVGGGMAYSVHGRGYNTFSLVDPANPVLLGVGNTLQFGWRQIVPNGSGLGVAVVGPFVSDSPAHELYLHDVSNPAQNDVFLTLFPTPGIARAATIFNALAYVADDTAGLQVVNYLAYDSKGVPPAITLTTSAVGDTVEATTTLRLTANATDDVQVREVEFYVDGQRAFSDGNFPFEHWFITPSPTATKTNLTLRARAIDTGGNATWSSELVLKLEPDKTPPRILAVTPTVGSKTLSHVAVVFSEPIAPSTLTSASFRLVSGGPDGQLDTGDEVPVGDGVVTYHDSSRSATLDFAASLPLGLYRAVISTSVTDLAGNHVASDTTWDFRVADAVFWISPIDGVWEDLANWSTGTIPGPDDNVVIDVSGRDVIVTHATGSHRIKGLIANEGLRITGNSVLEVPGGIQLGQDLTLNGGTIKGGTVTQSVGGKLLFSNSTGNVLDGVAVNGDLDLTTQGALVRIRNGLSVNGTVRLDKNAMIYFAGDQAFNTGQLSLEGFGTFGIDPGTTLTLGPAVVIRGGSGFVGGSAFGTRKLINQGVISADEAGGTITIMPSVFENAGTVECKNGGSVTLQTDTKNTSAINATGGGALTIAGTWGNSGTISATDSTVNLGGTFTLANLGTFNRSGGTVNLTGVIDLSGGTLALNANTGSWRLNGGTIKGGTVTQDGGAKLDFSNSTGNSLDALTVVGGLEVSGTFFVVRIRNGLTLEGVMRIDTSASVYFTGDQTFNTGEILLSNSATLGIDPGTTLTLGPAMVVRGNASSIGSGFGVAIRKLVNQGLITADAPGSSLTINPSQFENAGTVKADGTGTTVTIRANPFTNTGTIQELNGGKVLINP